MDSKLINYNGIDDIDLIDKENNHIFDINQYIVTDKKIEDLLSFSASGEIINTKEIGIFEDVNYEGDEIESNLFVLTIKYDLMFEFSTKENISKINALNKVIYKTFFFKPININYTKANIYTIDMVCIKNSENEIYYTIYGCIL